ncbi:GNAT family N-acetyltransferase [Aquisalibacillus elongatus]|uniref:ClpA/ClpB-like protein n=1 Tax=Aquisalibacillus elongatus TaxID=485577 RepID=A0A3N5C5K9_9BACI|nr:GNAT family N-acetyltransferase [Aquisalibacillus elongatus]RPF53495.1 ClpA/ClpB-like protein [Aquisalibacillus elongatus]
MITNRIKQIIERAEHEANYHCLLPEHLLLAFIQEKSGPFADTFLRLETNADQIRQLLPHTFEAAENEQIYSIPITETVKNITNQAWQYMKHYNQTVLNEGHLLKALIKSNSVHHLLSQKDALLLLELGTTSRDLIVHLRHYDKKASNDNIIRVNKLWEELLKEYISKHFGQGWLDTINSGLKQKLPNIYIFVKGDNILGFACFDTFEDLKGYFGPMGVAQHQRQKGIGSALLHHCLYEMKQIGYEYAIIGGAGPIEFYEKECGAKVIPK